MDIKFEAARLYSLGFGVHWIKANSKAPVKGNWANGTRDDIEIIKSEYKPGFGLGVRLGEASRFPDGTFLANIDLDIKSANPNDIESAFACFKKHFGTSLDKAPRVKTGYGMRYFFRTRTPVKSRKIETADNSVKVKMPNAPISAEQKAAVSANLLSEAELNAGFRIRRAWEIELMSAGRQVVLPPSVHPDTGLAYIWEEKVTSWSAIPIMHSLPDSIRNEKLETQHEEIKTPFVFNPVVVDCLDPRFSPSALNIISGENVHDRSSAAFSLAMSMVKNGFSDDEILSVLTDKDTYIGECAFEHRNTKDRYSAAQWANEYCLKKAKFEVSAQAAFENVVVVKAGGLSEKDAEAQKNDIIDKTPKHWKDTLQRSGKYGDGAFIPNLRNTRIFIDNLAPPGIFKKDLITMAEIYGAEGPWGGHVGALVTDDDMVLIKSWLAKKFKFEPATNTIFEVITDIALENAFHPVRDALLALEPWDGVDRFSGWLKKNFEAQGPDEYLTQVFRKWVVASVARTFEPGFKFDWLPIFEGPQGAGKSMFGSILFGNEYFNDWLPNLADKDAALGLIGKRCIEFSELDSLRRNEINTVKAFVARQVDNVRPPYGRKERKYERQCVFLGTTNSETYLVDETGNRRFNPVVVGRLDFEALKRDKDQLWAQALHIYQFDLEETLELTGEALADAEQIRSSKLVETDADIFKEILGDWLEKEKKKPVDQRFNISRFKITHLFESMGPLGGYKLNNRATQLVAKAIKGLGGHSKKIRGNFYWCLGFGEANDDME